MIKAETNKGDIAIKINGTTSQVMSELAYMNIQIIDSICEETDKEPKSFKNLLCRAMNRYYDMIGGSEDEQADADSEQA